MSRNLDTIAALATPAGTAALAVLRVSGVDTKALALALCGRVPPARVATHIDYHGSDGALIDDVLLTYFQAPSSYTGEDALEISSHGNPFIAQTILKDLFTRGCRSAAPGEFTERAFLNGRLDLTQAEAVMDLINARSERALAAANAQLRGSLGRKMEALINRLLGVIAQIEAYIDFPEEDLPREDRANVGNGIRCISLEINELVATSRYGAVLRDGLKTVILGAPNAGKSSLLNALVGRERALVSPEPGTTRDFIEERIIMGQHCVRLIDTAGLNPSPAPLERLGIGKTLELVEEADLFLLVVDVSDPQIEQVPDQVLQRLSAKNSLLVWSKADLSPRPLTEVGVPRLGSVPVSAVTGVGLDDLRSAMVEKANALSASHDMAGIAINARHTDALQRAGEGLASALDKIEVEGPVELIASDLRDALAALGEITGRIDNERMLDQLFASFCIGK